MKTKVGLIRRLTATVVMLFAFILGAWADGEANEVYIAGTSNSSAGDFVVQNTNDMFHYQGREYEVFRVYYDDPEENMKIAVNNEGICTSFVAFNGEYMFFYNCNKHGFGVRKVMFSNPWAKDDFSPQCFHDQSVLMKQKKIEKKMAVGLIAAYVPQMKDI